MTYRSKAQQHGPLGGHSRPTSEASSGQDSAAIQQASWGQRSGHQLGSVAPQKGEVWDRSELPARFDRLKWSTEEMEAVELGGAGLPMGWGGA